MSDSPYGQPPPSENPYGQQPPQNPYGGQPTPYASSGRDPEKRPGTVTAASIITLVCAGLGAVLFGLATIALLVARDTIAEDIRREIESDPAFEGTGMPSGDDLTSIFVVVMLVLLVWCLLACVFAVMAMRRSNVGRILLVVSASISALLSLVAILSGVSAITLIASIAVVVLLFTGGAGDWYARRGSQQQHDELPPGTTQPWA